MRLIPLQNLLFITVGVLSFFELVRRLWARRRAAAVKLSDKVWEVEVFGVLWDLTQDVFEAATSVRNTGLENYSVRGPYCTVCKTLLQRSGPDGQSLIVNPCPVCTKSHQIPDGSRVTESKADVWSRALRIRSHEEI